MSKEADNWTDISYNIVKNREPCWLVHQATVHESGGNMVNLNEMTREELLEVIAIKNKLIEELREEIINYQELIQQIQKKQA